MKMLLNFAAFQLGWFACVLCGANQLRWLRGRWTMDMLLGAAGGPLAYYAGARLGGVVVTEPVLAFAALALGWAAFVPLLIKLSTRFDGMRTVTLTTGA